MLLGIWGWYPAPRCRGRIGSTWPAGYRASPPHLAPSLAPFSADDSLYESPEPIFTSNNSCCSLRVPHAALAVVPVVWTLLAS